MAKKASKSTLTPTEKSVIKALLNEGWRNQDIQALINVGRAASINFGRISTIKSNDTIVPASKPQVEAFRRKKLLFDHITGLCPIDDERLVRAREAMILAVELFNTRTIGSFDRKWLPLFQASCLNFEKAITELFGPRLTLGRELGFSLQFAKLTTEEIATLQGFDVPEHIAALDASLAAKLEGGDADNI